MSKDAGLDYYLGAAGKNSFCSSLSASLKPPFPFSITDTEWSNLEDYPAIPWSENRVGAPKKGPTMLTELDVHPFKTGEIIGSGKTQCSTQPGGWAMWSVGSHPSYTSNDICLGICSIGGASSCVLGFSQGCLVHELLVSFSYEREE